MTFELEMLIVIIVSILFVMGLLLIINRFFSYLDKRKAQKTEKIRQEMMKARRYRHDGSMDDYFS